MRTHPGRAVIFVLFSLCASAACSQATSDAADALDASGLDSTASGDRHVSDRFNLDTLLDEQSQMDGLPDRAVPPDLVDAAADTGQPEVLDSGAKDLDLADIPDAVAHGDGEVLDSGAPDVGADGLDGIAETGGGDTELSDMPVSDASDVTDAEDAESDGSTPGEQLQMDWWGRRMYGTIIEVSRTDRTLWIGTSGNAAPPAIKTIRGGLVSLDLDTGKVRLYEGELPKYPYEINSIPALGPVPTAGVQEDLGVYVAVSKAGLLLIDGDKVTPVPVSVPGGMEVVPINLAIARDGGNAWAWLSSSAGLVRLDPDTWQTLAVFGPAQWGAAGGVGRVAVDPATGAAYVAFYPKDGSASSVKRVDPAGTITTFTPGDQGTPKGLVGDIIWSIEDGVAFVAVGAWNPYDGGAVSWDGTKATTIVNEGQLSLAAGGKALPFGAQALALDATNRMLLIGGRIQANPFGPSKGGGLAYVDLEKANNVAGVSLADVPFEAIHVVSMVFDPETRRTFVAVSGQCDETHLRSHGLYALSFQDEADGGPVRLERPVISGIRSLGLVGDQRIIAMRDDNPGLACQGYPIQTGVGELRSNRAAEVRRLGPMGGAISPVPGGTDLAVLDADHVALATWKEGLAFGNLAKPVVENPASAFKVSLRLDSVAWGDAQTLWIGGRTSHGPADPESLADVGPHGAARLDLDVSGGIKGFAHFVANSNLPADVKGLPSGDVRQVLPAGDGSTYLACAAERVNVAVFDRVEEDLFLLKGQPRLGGVARVLADSTVVIVADDSVAPDARVMAFDAAGDLVIGDAEVGLVRVSGGVATPLEPGLPVPEGSIPLALWFGPGDELAIGYDTGLAYRFAGSEGFVSEVGFVWEIMPDEGSLLVATDEGILRLWPDGVIPPAVPPPDPALLPPFQYIEPPVDPGGDCLPAGAACGAAPDDCCAGLSCVWGFVKTCQ